MIYAPKQYFYSSRETKKEKKRVEFQARNVTLQDGEKTAWYAERCKPAILNHAIDLDTIPHSDKGLGGTLRAHL